MAFDHNDLLIDEDTCRWTARFIRVLRRAIKLDISLIGTNQQIDEGEIFLFNHFARFETFIPQYLFYERAGVYCRSIASKSFFKEDNNLSNFMLRCGAVPNDLVNLMPFLVREVFHGRKVVIFPEGGMVKDKRVLDQLGEYKVFSRKAKTRRKHHRGAAVLAHQLYLVKRAIRHCEQYAPKNLDAWAEELQFDDVEQLLLRARKPTTIVPSGITFYPMRVSGHFLQTGLDLFSRGKLSPRLTEEILIEGNFLLRDTDMDIRLGPPIVIDESLYWWEKISARQQARQFFTLDSLSVPTHSLPLAKSLQQKANARLISRIRDRYMHAIYQQINLNLSHLAASIIMQLKRQGDDSCDRRDLVRLVYLAAKWLHQRDYKNLHRSLLNPESYHSLLEFHSTNLVRFLQIAEDQGLITREGADIQLLDALLVEPEFDTIRVDNPVMVYANEAYSVKPVRQYLAKFKKFSASVGKDSFADFRMQDLCRERDWDLNAFEGAQYEEINAKRTATADPYPYLLRPAGTSKTGILLVHGFLSSPSELKTLAEQFQAAGFMALGVRLKGHGTSPWDLRSRSRDDWARSVEQGFNILSGLVDNVICFGFSTGGLLALDLASKQPALAGVISVNAPLRFVSKGMAFVPVITGTNRLIRSVSPFDGILSFRANESEIPEVNYAHVPMRALSELKTLTEELPSRLEAVSCPCLLVQGDNDPTVDASSVDLLSEAINSQQKDLWLLEANSHGVVYNNLCDIQARLVAYVGKLAASAGFSQASS